VGEANLYNVIYSTFSVAYLSHWVQGWVLASEIASSTQYNTIFFCFTQGWHENSNDRYHWYI